MALHRKWLIFMLLSSITSVIKGMGQVSLVSENLNLPGVPQCPRTVQMTCIARNVTTLRWFINGMQHSFYAYTPGDTYPRPPTLVNTPLDGVEVVITTALQDAVDVERFDADSVLSTNLTVLIQQGIQRIQCGSGNVDVRSMVVNVDLVLQFPPSSPSTSCMLLSSPRGPEVILQWSPPFTSQQAVDAYHVAVNPDPSSCSSDRVSPNDDYSCSGLSLGTNYSITVSAINCGDQEGTRNVFTVEPQVPDSPANITVLPTYNENEELQELVVQWADQSHRAVPERCIMERSLNYSVELENTAAETIFQMIVISDNCSNGICYSLISNLPSNNSYRAFIHASSIFGQSSSVSSELIDGSIQHLFNLSLSNESCITSVNCSSFSSSGGECVVRYGQDSSYQEQGPPISGPFNSPFSLPLMEASTLYYFTFMLTVNSTRLRVNKTLMTRETSPSLTGQNIALISTGAVGVFVYTVIIVLCIIVSCDCDKDRYYFFIVLITIITMILLLVSILLWVATAIYIGQQNNTCDFTWQANRDALIISSFTLSNIGSLLFLLVLMFCLVVICIFFLAIECCII